MSTEDQNTQDPNTQDPNTQDQITQNENPVPLAEAQVVQNGQTQQQKLTRLALIMLFSTSSNVNRKIEDIKNAWKKVLIFFPKLIADVGGDAWFNSPGPKRNHAQSCK